MPVPLPKNRIWLEGTMAEPAFDPSGQYLYYVRGDGGGRYIVRHDLSSGLTQAITTEPRPGGTVGYGGGAYSVGDGMLVYAAEGRLVAIDLVTGKQEFVTPAYEGLAAPSLSPCSRFVVFVTEVDNHAEILLADTAGGTYPVKLSESPAFAANPTFSPDGTRVAWMEWAEDKMPWDESRLRLARLPRPSAEARGTYELLPVESVITVEAPNVSYASPQFSPDGERLAYTSDESGWRSLYIADADAQGGERIDTGVGEIGEPDWVQGTIAARWSQDARSIYMIRRHRARGDLLRVSMPERAVEILESPWSEFGYVAVGPGEPDLAAYIGIGNKQPTSLVTRVDGTECVRATVGVGINDPDGLADAEVIEWPAVDGTMVYGVLRRAVERERPRPLIVSVHGGPTSEEAVGWNPEAQYFAGRGWHYLDVNHRGGTGSGRAFQDMLRGQWGVVDVEDARSGAEHLIELGLVDPKRVVITGGSAGGYTTLKALVSDPDFWTAGISLYGIGNLYDLKLGSHRFEARYDEYCIGPLPEQAERWMDRSPLTHVKDVRAPVLLFHGKEDKAVPYEQSVEFAEAVRAMGGVAELVLYDDEGHGFRKASNRKDMIEKMEAFLEKYVLNLQGMKPRNPS